MPPAMHETGVNLARQQHFFLGTKTLEAEVSTQHSAFGPPPALGGADGALLLRTLHSNEQWLTADS